MECMDCKWLIRVREGLLKLVSQRPMCCRPFKEGFGVFWRLKMMDGGGYGGEKG